ncbi:MAG: hypothetical protein KAU02_02795 [Tenericutes bacterium]|nr:hypothetical protein [Mycoplasmatota bacterium]
MKKYFNTFVKTFFFTSLPMILLALIIYRRLNINLGYIRITLGTILISIFISIAISVFKSDKGKGYINAILGYIIIIPALFVFRYIFGTYVFKTVWLIYILIAVIGIIYGIALLVASKKYKSEVNELNRLLIDKDDNHLEE